MCTIYPVTVHLIVCYIINVSSGNILLIRNKKNMKTFANMSCPEDSRLCSVSLIYGSTTIGANSIQLKLNRGLLKLAIDG